MFLFSRLVESEILPFLLKVKLAKVNNLTRRMMIINRLSNDNEPRDLTVKSADL